MDSGSLETLRNTLLYIILGHFKGSRSVTQYWITTGWTRLEKTRPMERQKWADLRPKQELQLAEYYYGNMYESSNPKHII